MNKSTIQSIVTISCKRVAPAWPLKNFVAVNPYSGFTEMEFSSTAKAFSERGGIQLTMPIHFYLEQIDKHTIINADIIAALQKQGKEVNSIEEFKKSLHTLKAKQQHNRSKVSTLIDIASDLSDKNWSELMVDQISSWATSYFDDYVTLWNTSNANPKIYEAWKSDAEIDRSPDLMGLKGFRASIKNLPSNHLDAITAILTKLKLPEENIESYLHALLLKTIGWSSYISGVDFNNAIYQEESANLAQYLAILLAWEQYFISDFGNETVNANWYKQLYSSNSVAETNDPVLEAELILQDAYDFACQRELQESFKLHKEDESKKEVKAQVVFCIDVRSEAYRRNLEAVNPGIETVGFAGFFGFPINYVPVGHTKGKNQCPVLIPSSVTVKETFTDEEKARNKRVTKHQIEKTWKKFKSGPVTSFGFVSPLGISFLPKLLSNSFNLTRPVADPKLDGLKKHISEGRKLDLSAITLEEKISMSASALTGMGIKNQLAPLVLITGHGSSSVNNPHASGLDCGACGGHSGEINAMTAEQILNDPQVRRGLQEKGVRIPDETLFLACLHDTTTDHIEILNEHLIPQSHHSALQEIKESLKKATEINRVERSERLKVDSSQLQEMSRRILGRSKDWSQIRPEWGLAGCNAFVVAPRTRTRGMNLNGRAFLHSYDWKTDAESKILEAIMTAPMVVTSWINLQYYASTVDNQHFGAGNKTLHNVAGGIGVLEGGNGDLKIGLPLQSVHNGRELEHLPQRLNVIIEARIESINQILEKHANIKQLVDHSWITLLRLDENGIISHRYTQNLNWEATEKETIKKKRNVLQTA